MIDRKQAEVLADQHVQGLDRPADGYRLGRGDIVRVEEGWYFDCRIICELDIPEDQQEAFGGAPGFRVDETSGQLTAVSHAEWVDLGLAFNPAPYGSEEDVDKV